nr:SprB repeat-containing protein [Bacteroidota bacterium]
MAQCKLLRGNNGSASVTASGGTPSYTHVEQW